MSFSRQQIVILQNTPYRLNGPTRRVRQTFSCVFLFLDCNGYSILEVGRAGPLLCMKLKRYYSFQIFLFFFGIGTRQRRATEKPYRAKPFLVYTITRVTARFPSLRQAGREKWRFCPLRLHNTGTSSPHSSSSGPCPWRRPQAEAAPAGQLDRTIVFKYLYLYVLGMSSKTVGAIGIGESSAGW